MRARVVALGAGAALAIAFPAALVAQLVDAVADGDDPPVAVFALVPVVLAGTAIGGWVVGRRRPSHPILDGVLAGLAAMALVLGLGIARRAVAGEDVAWATVPTALAIAGVLAALGSALARRTPARTRA